MFKKCWKLLLGILVLLFSLILFPKLAEAQFSGELGSISGSVRWGSEVPQAIVVYFNGNTTGFTHQSSTTDFNTGFILPPDTYTVSVAIFPTGPDLVVGTQTVVVAGGQEVNNINFDLSITTGLVSGTLTINGTLSSGKIQFCSSLESEPCPSIGGNPHFPFGPSGFRSPLPAGDYRIHVTTSDDISVGIVPITITEGQLVEDSSLQFSLNLGSISGTVLWATESFQGPQGPIVYINGNNTGFSKQLSGTNFSTNSTLPPDTYTVSAAIVSPAGPDFVIGTQTIMVSEGQVISDVNFDASTVTGLAKGSLKINGVASSGRVQFCESTESTPCSKPYFPFSPTGFKAPLPPGDYRVHVTNQDNISAGNVSITIASGQVIEDPSLQFVLDLGSISGSVRWGTEVFDVAGPVVYFSGSTTGFTKQLQGSNFNTEFTLPPDTYTVNVAIFPTGPDVIIGTQTVIVAPGQSITGINFDVSTVTGLIKGNLTVNSILSAGKVQFCPPTATIPCSRPFFPFSSLGFSSPLPEGDYLLHVTTVNNVSMGALPITVIAGEIVDLSTTSVTVPTGQNVTVSLAGITVTFSEVTTSGFMNVTITDNVQGGLPPSQYKFLGTYYELTTTAIYTGPVTVSFTYDDADVTGREENLKLFHWDGTQWIDITVSLDTVNNVITGVTPTLSPFAIGEPINIPPTVSAGGPYNVNEGGSVQVSATGDDPEGGPLTYAWDLDNNGSFETPGQAVTFSAAGLDGPDSRTVAVQVTDEGGLTATAQSTVNIVNVAPVVGAITAPVDPNQVNSSINTSANFTDVGIPDTHTAVWDWGDATTSVGTVTETNGSGSVIGSHAYTTPGVYTVKLTVVDDDGGSGESIFQFVVVYDPEEGFVTGGGWIDSPSGAYTANPLLTGRANFGFVSKYQNGATVPTGQTEFHFKVASFNFHSTSYDWLVVAGPDAKYKGSGTINGGGDYAFMITARDGQISGGDGVDRFRIKIWDKNTNEVIYDNQMGESDDADATDAIEAGSIVIHQ